MAGWVRSVLGKRIADRGCATLHQEPGSASQEAIIHAGVHYSSRQAILLGKHGVEYDERYVFA
jgi:hypothetical protein